MFEHPCLYSGDFKCRHTNWRYDSISPGEECLANWAAQGNLVLLHNFKNASSFFSGRWHTSTNPDLTFASVSDESWSLDRRVLEKFSWSLLRPLPITAAKLVTAVPNAPHKRWNFRKVNWKLYSLITEKLAKDLPSPDFRCVNEACQDFYYFILQAAKRYPTWLQKQLQTILDCGV